MARVPLYREASTGLVVAKLKAGQNVTLTDAVVGSVLEVTVSASSGGGGTPSTTVTSGTTPGLQPVVGVSTSYARGDHSHGTPAVPAHTALGSLAWASAGHTGSSTAVAAWAANATATVVQATTDETMLVRRAGVLQWVPLMVGLSFLGDELVDDAVVLYLNNIVVYTGSIV